MDGSTVIAYLDDGPRAGEAISVHTGADGAAPDEVMVSNARGMGERAKETVEVGYALRGSTAYCLDGPARAANTFIYRCGTAA